VDSYRDGYAAIKYAFLPCVISTSGRLHGEFLRLLYIIAHRRTSNWLQAATKSPARKPSSSAVGNISGTRAPRSAKLRHGLSPNAERVPVAKHTLRRHRSPPYMQDDLAFPATLPSSDV
jgi:hypothetical protein